MRRRLFLTGLVVLWLLSLAGATRFLLGYQSAAGPAASSPDAWPRESSLHPTPGTPAALLFVHPHCPCSAASLDELAWLLARSPGAEAWVVFVVPPQAPPGWQEGPLWRAARAAPRLRVVADADGTEARRFGAETSGQVLVFRDGRLTFRGGITAGRGHRGQNPGRDSALAALRGDGTGVAPVYGCRLFDQSQTCEEDGCAK